MKRGSTPGRAASFCALGCLLLLCGCGQFFSKADSTGSGSGGSGGGSGGSSGGSGLDSIYVANTATSPQSISAFSLDTTGKLANLANSPSLLGVLPSAMAINPSGTLLWVGSILGTVYVYVINSDGSLTLGNSNQQVASVSASSMAVDPTGQWLLVLSSTGTDSQAQVSVYQIDASNGSLTQPGTPLTLDIGNPTQLVFSPNGTQAFAALGTGGVDSLTFNPSTGALGKLNVLLQPLGSGYADNALTVDPAGKYLFVGETGTLGIRVLTINADGTLTAVGNPTVTGFGINSLLVDATGSYLYAANYTSNSISAFTLGATGTLTQLAGSPFVTGTSPYALAEDSSGAFLVSANLGGTPDLQVFSIAGAAAATPGALTSASTASTGSVSPAGAVAVVATRP